MIPEEVIEAAAKAALDGAFMRHAPEDVPRWDDLVAESDPACESWREVARAVAPIIATWVREQALGEAEAALEALVRPAVTPGRLAQNHGVWDALAAIAALKGKAVPNE